MTTQDLYKKYPLIFAKVNGLEIGEGWADLVDQLCDYLQMQTKNNNLQVVATQVKTKFGGLRFYTERATREQQWVIGFVENLSINFCEECGSNQNVGQTSGSWVTTVCQKCFDKNKEKYKDKRLIPISQLRKLNNDGKDSVLSLDVKVVSVATTERPQTAGEQVLAARLKEADKTQMVMDCQNIAELKDVIRKISPVQGTQKLHTADKLIEKIEQIKLLGEFYIMTRTHGLRAKLMELSLYEKRETPNDRPA